MSNIKIQGNASGTGTTTVQSGNTNSDTTFTLPGVDGTNGQALVTNGSGVLSFGTVGSGSVTTVSVVSANGLAGSVANASTTPAITLSTSITGVLKGNGTAISAATAGTDYVAPATATNFTAKQTFTGSTSVAGMKIFDVLESATLASSAAIGTINYDVTSQVVLWYVNDATGNWTINFRGSSGTSLDTLMATGESLTAVFISTQAATAYRNTSVQVDGTTSGVSVRWQGSVPTQGNANSWDVYAYTIFKSGSAQYLVLASQTKFVA